MYNLFAFFFLKGNSLFIYFLFCVFNKGFVFVLLVTFDWPYICARCILICSFLGLIFKFRSGGKDESFDPKKYLNIIITLRYPKLIGY